jgi:hypothetical protein
MGSVLKFASAHGVIVSESWTDALMGTGYGAAFGCYLLAIRLGSRPTPTDSCA